MKTEATSNENEKHSNDLLTQYFDKAAYEVEDDYLKPAGSRYADHADDYGQNVSGFHLMMENDFDDDRS